MERPEHDMASAVKGSKQSRMTSGAVAIGINVAIIAALVAGLSSSQLRKAMVDISASVIAKKAAPKALPPPPPAMVRPPPTVAAPPPQIVIAAPPPPVVVPKAAPPPPPAIPPTEPKEIARTHTLPPYPALSQRMGEQGTTQLACEIGVDGKPTACSVTKTSGSPRLDEAASSYVKDHYTWQPATRDGKPVAGKTQLNVVWDLKNAS
jgi:periplasmic protein TonB